MSQKPQTQNLHPEPDSLDDEISLREIIQTLQKRWKTFAAFTLGTPLLAIVVGLAWPKQYEANALIQVARVGNLMAAISNEGALASAVESNAAAIRRLQSNAFESRLVKQLQVPVSIKATELKGTGLISLAVRAPSQASAEKAATLALAMLTEVHSEQVKGAVASLQQSVTSTKEEVTRMTVLLRSLSSKTNRKSRYEPAVAVLLSQTEGQLLRHESELRDRLLRLEVALSPLNTHHTQAIEAPVASKGSIVPRLSILLVSGLVAGGILGVLVALTLQARQSRGAVPTIS